MFRGFVTGWASAAVLACAAAGDEPGIAEPSVGVASPDAGAAAGPGGATAGGAGGEGASASLAKVHELDVLFMIDNSLSMNDKQEVLRVAVPDLVSRLTNPVCVDAAGNLFPPPAAGQLCPSGQRREFETSLDVHIGVISSSLGDVGANVACPVMGYPRYVPDRVDMAHLIGSLPRGRNPGSDPSGFLEWSAGSDVLSFDRDLQQMVTDVGDRGCAFESQLEAWYRFLVDPFPYRSLERVPCVSDGGLNCVQPAVGPDGRVLVDEALLEQRAAFLRDDSLVLIVMLTDENDCSTIPLNQTWVIFAIDDARPMFRASSACADNPNDKCCHSCPQPPPEGCAADPICNADPETGALENRLPPEADGQNVRCVDQKRRFGFNGLYPTQRYVNALREPVLCRNRLDLSVAGCPLEDQVQNPLFAAGRPAERVFLAGILGVPWQAIAAEVDAAGRPLPSGQLRFQSAEELSANGVWSAIVGSPGTPWRAASGAEPEVPGTPPVPPSFPQMVESMLPRPGIEPNNPINGREFETRSRQTMAPDELQYACIFPLAEPKDCAALDPMLDVCACFPGDTASPLCEQQPGTSAAGTTQYWAKAYPGLRQLEVLQGHGDRSILASICARNVTDPSAGDFGYRPAVAAMLERLREHLP